jgi:site-specific recombinase XerC
MTESMKSRWVRSNWSDVERQAFERALDKGDGFAEPGLGAEWSERTREHMEFGYGRYREFCVRTGRVVEFVSFRDIFRMDWIKAYYQELTPQLAPRTVLKALVDLSLSLRAMAPEVDRSPLVRVCSKIERTAERTKNIKDNLVPPPESLALARELISRARASRVQGKNAAALFRDGALIMAFSYAPLRLRNWVHCVIDQNIDLAAATGRLKFSPGELKRKKASRDEPLPEELDLVLRDYKEIFRARLVAGLRKDHGFFWVSRSGKAMTDDVMSERVRQIMRRAFNKQHGPHMFRHDAATYIANVAPHMARIATGVLGHTKFRTTSDNYIHGQHKHLLRKYQGAVKKIQNDAKRGGRQGRTD